MKFAIVTLAVVFNITLVVMYSRSLVGGAAPAQTPAASQPVPERSASSPYKPAAAESEKRETARQSAVRSPEKAAEAKGTAETAEPVRSGDGKETIDPKDGKATLEPVAENVRALRLRSGQGGPTPELLPGRETRGILAPANPANVDPPVVSPEAR
jgi:hypothetical protein